MFSFIRAQYHGWEREHRSDRGHGLAVLPARLKDDELELLASTF